MKPARIRLFARQTTQGSCQKMLAGKAWDFSSLEAAQGRVPPRASTVLNKAAQIQRHLPSS
jgi:hypothetical protein